MRVEPPRVFIAGEYRDNPKFDKERWARRRREIAQCEGCQRAARETGYVTTRCLLHLDD